MVAMYDSASSSGGSSYVKLASSARCRCLHVCMYLSARRSCNSGGVGLCLMPILASCVAIGLKQFSSSVFSSTTLCQGYIDDGFRPNLTHRTL